MYMSVYECYALVGACREQKIISDLLKLHVFMSLFFTWVLETELESYGRVVKTCNLVAISPAFVLHQFGWLSFYTWPYSASNPYFSLGIYT